MPPTFGISRVKLGKLITNPKPFSASAALPSPGAFSGGSGTASGGSGAPTTGRPVTASPGRIDTTDVMGGGSSGGGSGAGGSGGGTGGLTEQLNLDRMAARAGVRAIAPSPAVATAIADIKKTTQIGIDVLDSSNGFNNKNGLLSIRPEFIALTKFLQTINIDGITSTVQLMNTQYNLSQLRQENLFRIMTTISGDTSNSYNLLINLRKAFDSELKKLTEQLNGLKEINFNLNVLKNTLELKSTTNGHYNTQDFLTLKDFYTSKMGFTDTQFQTFSDSKIYLQLLFDFSKILTNYSFSIFGGIDPDRSSDSSATTVDNTYTINSGFDFTKTTLSNKYCFTRGNFTGFLASLPSDPIVRIKLLTTVVSKVLLLSRNFDDNLVEKIKNYFSNSTLLSSDKTNFPNLIIGNIPSSIFTEPVEINSNNKKLKEYVSLKDNTNVLFKNKTVLLPFENKYIDDVENKKTFIPGSSYYVDSIIRPIGGEFFTERFNRITSFQTNEYKNFANDFIEQNNKALEIISILNDNFNTNHSCLINKKILNSLKNILQLIDEPSDTTDVSYLFLLCLFKKANTNITLKERLFELCFLKAARIPETLGAETVEGDFSRIASKEYETFINEVNPLLNPFYPGDLIIDEYKKQIIDQIIDDSGELRNTFTRIGSDVLTVGTFFGETGTESKKIVNTDKNAINNNFLNNNMSSPLVIFTNMIRDIMQTYENSSVGNENKAFFYNPSERLNKTYFANYQPSAIILIIYEIFCQYVDLFCSIDVEIQGGGTVETRELRFKINTAENSVNINMVNGFLSEVDTTGIGTQKITSLGAQSQNYNPSSPGAGPVRTRERTTQNSILNNINSALIGEEKVIPNILHILWSFSQNFANGISKINSQFTTEKYTEYSKIFNDFNLNFSDLINPTQIRLNTYILDTLKEKIPSRVSTNTETPANNVLLTDIIQKEELTMLYSYLRQKKFSSDTANTKIKIISVGIPDGFSQKISQRISGNTKNPGLSLNNLNIDSEIDILTVNVYKRSHLHDGLIFKPQKFLFDLSLFQKEKKIININPDFRENYQNLLSRNILTDYSEPMFPIEVSLDSIISNSRYNSKLTPQEIRQLFENTNASYLLNLYLNLLTGINISEEEILLNPAVDSTISPIVTQQNLRQQLIVALNGYVNNNLNYPGSIPIDSINQTKALLDPNIPLDVKDVISLISNGSSVLGIDEISTKIKSAKAFERIFHIAFDDQEFIIDREKMDTSPSGRDFLVSPDFRKFVGTGDKLNEIYYETAFKIDSYHLQLEAQFI